MPDKQIRVRFAPSPTGNLHIGGARTAIYNWAFAKHHGGSFILRIEDTDPTRSTPENTAQIIRSLKWLGLSWDEGPEVGGAAGPYLQTQRFGTYGEALERLKANSAVYPCFCTAAELEQKRAAAQAAKQYSGYDRTCRNISEAEAAARIADGEPHTWRIKLPLDREAVVFEDLVYGEIRVALEQLDDFILVRTDGSPTYNFVVAVDDYLMQISHVIRGDDHLSNTPKQILVYQGLGVQPPRFAHLSMILGNDSKRLSKRHGATSVEAYKAAGYLPEALTNYLALLGWSLDGQTTVVDAQTLVDNFSLSRVSKNPAIFDGEKLDWLNQLYLKQIGAEAFVEVWLPYLLKDGLLRGKTGADTAQRLIEAAQKTSDLDECDAEAIQIDEGISQQIIEDVKTNPDWYAEVYPLIVERIHHLDEVNAKVAYLFCADNVYFDQKSVEKCLQVEGCAELLAAVQQTLANSTLQWQPEIIEAQLRELPEQLSVKPKILFQALRVAICGSMVSPPLFESIYLIGKEFSLARIAKAIILAST
jgi:glutamyl-tRNA synthetase